jgi:hypothetical protein
MGAEQFFTTSSGKTAKAAFKSAVDDALYDHGHSGYSGTIAEKQDFIMCSKDVFASYTEAEDFAYKLMDDPNCPVDDKWGPAGCVLFKTKKDETSYLFFGWASS